MPYFILISKYIMAAIKHYTAEVAALDCLCIGSEFLISAKHSAPPAMPKNSVKKLLRFCGFRAWKLAEHTGTQVTERRLQ